MFAAAMMTDVKTNNESPQIARQPSGQRLVEIVLILLVFFIVGGDPPPHVNEPHYLGRLKHFWNPQWCAGDQFLRSADTQVAFIWTFGWVTRWLSLEATAWVGRFVAWTLLAWAWQRLSWRLIPVRLAAVLSAALFVLLMVAGHMAGEWVVGGVEAKCFAYVFVLAALSEMIDRRWNAVWFLIGTATAFHPIVGLWNGVVCGGIWLLDDRRQVGLLAMMPGLVAGGLLALVGVVPALALTGNVPADVAAESARIYVFERLPHHLALLTLPANEIELRIARHAVLIVLLIALMGAARRDAAVAAPLGRIGRFALGAVLLALAGFAIEIALWNDPLLAARLLRYYWFRLTDFAVPMAVALYAVALIAAGFARKRAWATWALTATLILAGICLSTIARQRAIHPVPPADQQARDFTAWVEACNWIAKNTPPDAVFLTPRSSQSFKWRAGRAEVANRKDIPQDARSILEWHRRLKNVFRCDMNGVAEWVDSPSQLSTDRVRQLAFEYGFDYALADRSGRLSLPIVYQNEFYVVYRVQH